MKLQQKALAHLSLAGGRYHPLRDGFDSVTRRVKCLIKLKREVTFTHDLPPFTEI